VTGAAQAPTSPLVDTDQPIACRVVHDPSYPEGDCATFTWA